MPKKVQGSQKMPGQNQSMNSKERDPFFQVKTCARKIWVQNKVLVPPEKMTLFRAKDCSKNKWNLHLLRPDIAPKKVGVFEKENTPWGQTRRNSCFFRAKHYAKKSAGSQKL